MPERLRGDAYEQERECGENTERPPTHQTPLQQYRNVVTFTKPHDDIADNMLGCRHEIKYVISESMAAAAAQFIKPYLPFDHYCKSLPNHEYPLASLYLDSPDLRLCRESLEGHKNRFKLRIRIYNDALYAPRFLEIKRRVNTVIIKSRARITYNDAIAVLAGKPIKLQDKKDDEIFRQFRLYMDSINARPVVKIRYTRQAYENDLENRVRVTFDRNLCYDISDSPHISLIGGQWRRHHLKGVILEMKFTGRYPTWLGQMVEYLNLTQQSISKYATSIQGACNMGFCAPKIINLMY